MTHLAPLVGLYSPAPGSGKSTLAAALAEIYGYRTAKFAGPLKAMLRAMVLEAGVEPDDIERMLEGDLKEVPALALAGRTPRYAMQALGTEFGRNCMAEDYWVRLLLLRSFLLREQGVPVVVDDMRYPNEAQAVRDAGGVLVRVERPAAMRQPDHSSEGALDEWRFDLVALNIAPTAEVFVSGWVDRVAAEAARARSGGVS